MHALIKIYSDRNRFLPLRIFWEKNDSMMYFTCIKINYEPIIFECICYSYWFNPNLFILKKSFFQSFLAIEIWYTKSYCRIRYFQVYLPIKSSGLTYYHHHYHLFWLCWMLDWISAFASIVFEHLKALLVHW